jgi:hypothetical protein
MLVVASVLTYGFGGLIYWAARRKHLICPRCGLGWEHASTALAVTGPEPERMMIEAEPDEPLPGAGLKRRILGTGMVLLASLMVLMVLMGFVEWELGVAAFGSVLGAGGSGMFYWGWQGLQERRKAIMNGLERKILKLAGMRDGRLTVTEVAADMNLPLATADKILTSMDDGFRIRSEISKEGVLYYEFPELVYRNQIGSGDEPTRPTD